MNIYWRRNKISIFLTAVLLCLQSFLLTTSSFSAQEPRSATSGETLILAPQGLQAKEQAELERQYRFTYRDKGAILSPYISAEGAGIPSGLASEEDLKQEKLYRYFGAAMGLYKDGRLDEAIEILKYIAEENPKDEYINVNLNKLINEKKVQKTKWRARSESDARLLKEQKLKNLINDGVDYYKQRRFDMALLKFSDALSLDPLNQDAIQYLEKLKEYYLKENQMEEIIDEYENPQEVKPREKNDTERLLDEKERQMDNMAEQLLVNKESSAETVAKKLLDNKELEYIVNEKRLANILNQTELGLKVEGIITQKKIEEVISRSYTLGAGDMIQLSVRDHPELSGKAVIRLNGEIVLPLVNDVIKVKGLTLEEATEKITEGMVRYVKDPVVTIAIEEYKSKVFYVVDEIGSTPYPITRTNLTLRDALFVADWGDNRALGRVIVMKPHKLHPIIRKIDAFDIIYRGNLANNIRIEDGDVIYVPLTFAAKTSKTIADAMSPFAAVRQVRDEWLNLKYHRRGYRDFLRLPGDRDLQDMDASSATASQFSLVTQ